MNGKKKGQKKCKHIPVHTRRMLITFIVLYIFYYLAPCKVSLHDDAMGSKHGDSAPIYSLSLYITILCECLADPVIIAKIIYIKTQKSDTPIKHLPSNKRCACYMNNESDHK
jgi:uncharacterized membrane protein YozB (DUF420 family)